MTRFSPVRSLPFLLGLTLLLAACDASIDGDDAALDLTTDEADEAAEIVAEALAEDGAGLFATARDLTASVSPDGLADGPRSIRGHHDGRPLDFARCRGGDFGLTYDETTGTHLVSYSCSFEGEHVQKSYDALLAYQYRDADGDFVLRPVANWDDVDSVAFGGTHEGTVQITRGAFASASAFEQQGQWSLAGLSDDSTPALFSGSQTRTGTRARTTPNRTVERAFSVAFGSDGIEVTPNEDGSGYAAVGTLTYTLTMDVTRNGQTRTRTVEGTIELQGNGRALLRIIGLRGVYRVSLGGGNVVPVS